MQRVTSMTEGNPAKLILSFAFLLILTNVGQQLYMIVDASVVGRGIGVKALAARPLLVLLQTPEDIIGGATVYLLTMISGTLIVMAYNMAAAVLRTFGDGRSPLHAMLIAAFLNAGLDLLFVMVFRWGIFGAAIASVSAQLVSFLYCLTQIKKIAYVQIPKNTWIPDRKMLKELLAFGLPIAFQYIVIAISGIVLQSTINTQGSSFIAGCTATNKLYGLLESTAISLGLAFSTFFSQNYGAGKKARMKKGVQTGVKIVVAAAA